MEAVLRETGTIRLHREAMKYRHPRMELGHAVRLAVSLPDRTWIVDVAGSSHCAVMR